MGVSTWAVQGVAWPHLGEEEVVGDEFEAARPIHLGAQRH